MNIPYFLCKRCRTPNGDVNSNLRINQTGESVKGFQVPFTIKAVEVECTKCLKKTTLKVQA